MAPTTILPEEQSRELLALDETTLRQQLGLQLSVIYNDPTRSLQPAPRAQAMAALTLPKLPPWVTNAVDALVNRAISELEKVLCSQDPVYADLRNRLITASGLGEVALVAAVTAFLVGPLGISLAVAGILAAIVVKTVGEPAISAGVESICRSLGQQGSAPASPPPAGTA